MRSMASVWPPRLSCEMRFALVSASTSFVTTYGAVLQGTRCRHCSAFWTTSRRVRRAKSSRKSWLVSCFRSRDAQRYRDGYRPKLKVDFELCYDKVNVKDERVATSDPSP